MSILKLILTAVFAVSTTIPAFAQTEPERKDNEVVWTETDGVTIPLPPKAHPRLYLRDANVPELREKMKTTEGKAILKKIKKAAKPRTAEEEAAVTDHGFRYYAQMRGVTSQ